MIIPARNAAAHIEKQLLALAAQRTEVAWELIVADNGSTDETVAIVRRSTSEFPVPVRILDAAARTDAIGARNAGAEVAAGELLLFADADDVVDEQWVDEMVNALREHPFVGGRLEVGALNGEEVVSWRDNVFDRALPTFGGRPWAQGCNLGCTAAAFDAVGGFKEEVVGFNDVDLSMAMGAHGMSPAFAERAVVHYRYRNQPKQALRQMWRYGRQGGLRYTRYEIAPPTALDVSIVCFRSVKQLAREVLRGRRPVRPLVDAAYALGEASSLRSNPAFWQPVYRNVRPAAPWCVQRDRIGRLGRRVASRVRAQRS